MNWVAVIWAVSSGASLMLGLTQLLIWVRSSREAREYLALSFAAFAVAGLAFCEWLLMASSQPEEYARILRWAHVPATVMLVALVAFVRFYFRTGMDWLAWTVVGLRGLVLALNFLTPENLNFSEITALKQIGFLGEQVTVIGTAVSNPWNRLAEFSEALLLWYVLDASLRLWRKGEPVARRKALLVGGGILFFIVLAALHCVLVHVQVIQSPYIISFAFLGIILPVSHELGHEVLAAAALTEKLHAAQNQMNLAASAAKLALWTWDASSGILSVAGEGGGVHGIPSNTPVNPEQLLLTVHPEDREGVRHAMLASLSSGSHYVRDYRIVLPDGQTRWISARGNLERGRHGEPLVMRGVFMDVSDRRLAEERARLVVDAAPNAMIMVDSAANMTLVNREAEITFGYARTEMLGQPIEMLIPPRFSAGHPSLHAGFFRKPEKRPMGAGRELYGRRRDGSEVPVEIGLTPVQTSEGTFVLASIIDISGRLRREKEAAERRAELMHLSRLSLLGQLSGSLAHELNQPLAIILSNAEAAEQMLDGNEPEREELREIIRDIISEDLRAGEIIKNLRQLLRKGESRLQPQSINDVVATVLRLMRNDLSARGVSVETDLAADLPPVSADAVQLQQVLMNLILNACDAMSDNPPDRHLLRVSTRLHGNAVRLSVQDQGSGLPAGGSAPLFAAFYTTKVDGLGLGLSICSSIVAAHQGRIWGESLEGGGAVFHVELHACAHPES